MKGLQATDCDNVQVHIHEACYRLHYNHGPHFSAYFEANALMIVLT